MQVIAIKVSQGIQITIGKIHRKFIVIPVIAVLSRFNGNQSGPGLRNNHLIRPTIACYPVLSGRYS